MSKSGVGGIRKVVRDWDGKMGCLDFDGVRVDVPHALAHLSCNLVARNYDSSGLGPVLDVIAATRSLFTEDITEDADISGITICLVLALAWT